jgi:hypothetical protein
MYMSMNMGGEGEGVDYSDFVSQMVVIETGLDATGQGARIRAAHNVEPLEGQGGLSANEVAELVYLETSAQVEWDDETNDQNVATQGEYRGAVGVNLPATDSAFPARTQVEGTGEIISTQNGDEPDIVRQYSLTDNAYLQQFMAYATAPFDDQTSGPGGSGSNEGFYAEKPYRSLTNRGPVLDQNDDITVLDSLIVGDSIIAQTGVLRLHMLWDVAETDDSGRRFSVPF